MLWMMVPCLLLLGFLFWGGGRLPSTNFGYFWAVLIGVFLAVHVWMMFKGHGDQEHDSKNQDTRNKNK